MRKLTSISAMGALGAVVRAGVLRPCGLPLTLQRLLRGMPTICCPLAFLSRGGIMRLKGGILWPPIEQARARNRRDAIPLGQEAAGEIIIHPVMGERRIVPSHLLPNESSHNPVLRVGIPPFHGDVTRLVGSMHIQRPLSDRVVKV